MHGDGKHETQKRRTKKELPQHSDLRPLLQTPIRSRILPSEPPQAAIYSTRVAGRLNRATCIPSCRRNALTKPSAHNSADDFLLPAPKACTLSCHALPFPAMPFSPERAQEHKKLYLRDDPGYCRSGVTVPVCTIHDTLQ